LRHSSYTYIATIFDLKFIVKEVHNLMAFQRNIFVIVDLRSRRLVFFESSRPRMVFVIAKLGSNNLEERRHSKEVFYR
jgi:hypothetical protein